MNAAEVLLGSGILPAGYAATFQGLGLLPGDIISTPRGMSGDGKIVVGISQSPTSYQSFRWTPDGGMRSLPLPEGKSVTGISMDGTVLLGWDRFASQSFTGTEQTGFVLVGDLPGGDNYSSGHAVSADGKVVVGRGSSFNGTAEPFRWTASDGITGLGDLPGGTFFGEANAVSGDGRVVVGSSHVLIGSETFWWTVEEGMVSLGDFPGGGTNGVALGISANGLVVVGRAYPGTFDEATHEAFFWTAEAGMVHLGFAEGDEDSIAYACSDDGNTIVGDNPFRHPGYAVIWQPSRGMRHLADVLTEYGIDLTGWTLTGTGLISNDGTVIVGSGTNPAGNREGWIATIPRYQVQLSIQISPAGSVVVSWPSPSSGYGLEVTENLALEQTLWKPVATPVSDDGAVRCVTVQRSTVPQYFRLFQIKESKGSPIRALIK